MGSREESPLGLGSDDSPTPCLSSTRRTNVAGFKGKRVESVEEEEENDYFESEMRDMTPIKTPLSINTLMTYKNDNQLSPTLEIKVNIYFQLRFFLQLRPK